MRKLRIYLVGRITDLPDKGKAWRDNYMKEISQKIESVEYVGPLVEYTNEDDCLAIIRQDIKLIQKSDVIIVNATIPFVLGGPMELLLAKYFNKLAITVFNDNSPYYKNGKIHPWLKSFSDYIVNSLTEAIEIIKKFQKSEKTICIKTWWDILA
jgi:hypothetical protein